MNDAPFRCWSRRSPPLETSAPAVCARNQTSAGAMAGCALLAVPGEATLSQFWRRLSLF